MYISRSDWREFVERLAAAERRTKEYNTLVLAYQHDLDRARIQILALETRVGVAEEKYCLIKDGLADLLDQE